MEEGTRRNTRTRRFGHIVVEIDFDREVLSSGSIAFVISSFTPIHETFRCTLAAHRGHMNIALARIDDRLIHGQVVTAWLNVIGRCDEILICDDKTRQDQFLQQVLKMTAPPDIRLRVLSVDETIADFQAKPKDPARVLLLTRGPDPMLRLLEGGVPMTHINLGGMGAGPGRRNLHRSVSMSEEDMNLFRQILGKGVKVEIKMVPSDRGVDLAHLDIIGRR